MTSLIARLEASTEPLRELDAEICIALQYGGDNSDGATNVRHDPDDEGWLIFEIDEDACCNPVPELTSSLDAAVALAERVLPGWGYVAQNCGTPKAVVVKDDEIYDSSGATPAIALCIAILKAKETSHDPR